MYDESPTAAPGPPVAPNRVSTPPGWYPDPLLRFEHRYHNGQRWTADVSSDGTRLLDPLGVDPTPPHLVPPRALPAHVAAVVAPGWHLPPVPARHPAHTMSVLALVLGIIGVVLAAVPFLFVIGGAAAIAALVLGIIALGRVRTSAVPERTIRGRSIAGIVLAPIALTLCVVGVHLTRLTMRELDEYTEPGPFRLQIESCTVDSGFASVAGTITNDDDRSREYVVVIEYRNSGSVDGEDRVEVGPVAAGATASWSDGRLLRGVEPGDLTCTTRKVTGPYPFGVPQDD